MGMSSVLDTVLQANSMPLLLSTTVLQAGKWTIQQSERRGGLSLQPQCCRPSAAAAVAAAPLPPAGSPHPEPPSGGPLLLIT